jgi:predicted helicase
MTQLFPKNVIGVQTHRDQLVVAFTERDLPARLEKFADQSVPDSYWEAQDVRSTRDWKLRDARRSLGEESPRNVMRWTYRPFDRRWIAFDERLIEFTRTEVSPHLVGHSENLSIAFAYGSLPDGPYALVSRTPVPAAVLSWRTFGQAYMAPVWLHDPLHGMLPNFPSHLTERLRRSGIETNVEGLLHYVYAVLNSPLYRTEYAHGLRYDFARVPITRAADIFSQLRSAGHELAALHLLEHPELESAGPRMDGDDRSAIQAPRYDAAEQTLYIADNLVARPVPPESWAYQHGSYPVIRNFLEARKGRPLEAEEFREFRQIVAAVTLTVRPLHAIDDLVTQAIRNAFSATDLDLRDTAQA